MRALAPVTADATTLPPTKAGGRGNARRASAARRGEQHAKTKRVVIVLSLFLTLLAVALLVGGRVLIDPMLHAAALARDAHRMGDVVFTMPDGTLCRHMSFDNSTANLTETATGNCPQARPHPLSRTLSSGFAWGTR